MVIAYNAPAGDFSVQGGKFYPLLRPVCVPLTYNDEYGLHHFSSE
jgi:hypothetical protein